MKGLIIMISCIVLCTDSSGQAKERGRVSISLDILSFVNRNTADILFSHPFHTNWSAEGGGSVVIPDMKRKHTEKLEHEKNLDIEEKSGTTENIRAEHRFMIGMRYWPAGYPEGPHLSMSSVFWTKDSPDILLEGGYAIKIWKGIGADLGYRHTVINTSKKEDEDIIKGIYVSLYYRF